MEWRSCRRRLMMQRIMRRSMEINNAEFYVGKAEEVLPDYYEEYAKTHGGEKARADVIVVDPPRKGCDEIAA